MVENAVLDPSRVQFALTALYHFLFVPLTLGLIVIIAIMETIYVKTGKEIYKDMTRFWGKLFGINFAIGVATGLTMEFQFGTNWSYYSHFVGDIFGAPLAIEGLVAFFLESTLVGLMFFGWDRMSKKTHLCVSWLTAIGTNLSALWILVANGWMQHPVGSELNPETVRHEVVNFIQVVLNPVAQAKFMHTVSAGYVFGAAFVLGISAWYMLKGRTGRDLEFARKSFVVAAIFGLIFSLSVVFFGHESGGHVREYQPGKMAAIEAHYTGVDGCIDFKLLAWPSYKSSTDFKENDSFLYIPCGTSLVNFYRPNISREKGQVILGAKELVEQNVTRVKNGILADEALQVISGKKVFDHDEEKAKALETAKITFDKYKQDWGYGQLVKAHIPAHRSISSATEAEIQAAAEFSIPKGMPSLFYSFRIMVGIGSFLIFLFAWATINAVKRRVGHSRLLLRVALFSIPLPLIAIECGWFVAEYGRQPWAIEGVLPTFLAVSGITVAEIWFTLIGILALYTGFLIAEMYLMFKYARLGPSALKTGRYSLENSSSKEV